MDKITVTVIAKNEEELIDECLQSVSWADEIVFIDSESSDNTVNIAQKYTQKVFVKKWEGFVPQKRYAVALASNDWVLSIDADERVSEELKNEIIGLSPDDFSGFKIPRRNYFLKKHIYTCGWNKDYQLRLFNKKVTELPDRLVHEGFNVNGKTGELKNHIDHFSFNSVEKAISKINLYSSLQAIEIYQNKSKVGGMTLITHTASSFFRIFISLKGYKQGIYGMMIAFFDSITTLLTYMKIWELQNKEK